MSCHSSGKTILKRQYIYLCAPQYKYFLKEFWEDWTNKSSAAECVADPSHLSLYRRELF